MCLMLDMTYSAAGHVHWHTAICHSLAFLSMPSRGVDEADCMMHSPLNCSCSQEFDGVLSQDEFSLLACHGVHPMSCSMSGDV